MPWAITWNIAPWKPAGVMMRHAQQHVAHVADRAVGDQPLEVGLGHGTQGAVDDVDHGQHAQDPGHHFDRAGVGRIG